MNKAFSTASLQHIAVTPASGDAAHRVISKKDFADAWAEITAWQGYAPTPLVSLSVWQSRLALGALTINTKAHVWLRQFQSPRRGLCGDARVATRSEQKKLGRAVSLEDIRKALMPRRVAR